MLHAFDESLILLTYKGKILLMIRNYNVIAKVQEPWCMIGGGRENHESFEQALIRKIKEDMHIEFNSMSFVLASRVDQKSVHFYHGKLTDNNVNRIERSEGQELQFFDLKELERLDLTTSTNLFLTDHRDAVEKLLVN